MSDESNQRKWDLRLLQMATLEVASWSKDPSSKVGALAVSPDRALIIPGYNGFPRGVRDDVDRYNNRELKLLIVQHAEKNALRFLSNTDMGWTLYSSHMPCPQCTGFAAQKSIKRIVWLVQDEYQERWSDQLFFSNLVMQEVGIESQAYTWKELNDAIQ